jgi:beta-N-acetylhexosaminidase
MEKSKRAIIGIQGLELNDKEIFILKTYSPLGIILFSRNINNKEQVKKLISNIRNALGWKCPILIDQEGGRVQRLTRPVWAKYPPASIFGDIADISLSKAKRAVYLNYILLGSDLQELGININCAPCLDVKSKNMHSIIGDRAFSDKYNVVSSLGEAACNGLIDSGVLPIIKHIPGHGKSIVDSHKELPKITESIEVLEKSDFLPFKALSKMPIAMTAHILYTNIDDNFPITQSKKAYDYIRSVIKYEGILLSDDIDMLALSGSTKNKVTSIIKAGFDIILHCSGNVHDVKQVLVNTPSLGGILFSKLKLSLDKIENTYIANNKEIYKKEINKTFYDLLKINSDYY